MLIDPSVWARVKRELPVVLAAFAPAGDTIAHVLPTQFGAGFRRR